MSLVVLVVALVSLRSLAVLWTDQLWFSSVHLSNVFSTLLEIKIGLGVTFGVFFFLLLFGNLLLADRFGARDLSFDPDDELVRRFQDLVRPYARRTYALIAFIAGGIAGLTATSQWQNYILFANAQSFHKKDPIFHKDLGFYIFRLPFLTFVVDWLLAALIAVIVITAFFHYLNGGIRTSRTSPRVSPQVKVHLSVLLAFVALTKAAGYVIAKWQLVISANGYVNGPGYADVHARMPALTILFFLSLAASVILLYNIRTRGWSLPLLAVGLWVFVAVVIGYIYPSALQAFKVTPAQSTLEIPYIQRNITATRAAYGIDNVVDHPYTAAQTISSKELASSAATLNNIRLWDPSPDIALATTQRRQALQSYYDFSAMAVDRYYLNGKLTPVLIGARQINPSALPASSWVNEHLVYTHGYGAAIMPANQADPATGYPIFAMGNVPPTSLQGLPTLTQPDIYFGLNLPGWVVADSKQKELDYKSSLTGNLVDTHYQGSGGVQIGGLLRRAAFAIRFGDFNLFISDQVTSSSRIIFVRNVLTMAQKAAPFISWDNEPYPVVSNGQIEYVLDGFTSTNEYPYSQNADTLQNAVGGGLPSSFNYVRNSVKLVVNAYTGSMTFYAWDPSDPILQAYRAAFPHMFKAMSSMPAAIQAHLRYPAALFAVQAAMLGRYHITEAPAFYTSADQWTISPTFGSGPATQSLARTDIVNSQDEIISSQLSPMAPVYQVMALPNTATQQLLLSTAFVPAGNSNTQNLTAFMIATSNFNDYGQLNVYITPRGQSVTGPVQADAEMQENTTVSPIISLLDQHGSSALLGNNLMIPLSDSVLYVRPLYVTSTANPLPQLKDVIAVFNNKVGIAATLAGALDDVLGIGGSTVTPPPTNTKLSATTYLTEALASYVNAQTALKNGNLATYQADIATMNRDVQLAQSALARGK